MWTSVLSAAGALTLIVLVIMLLHHERWVAPYKMLNCDERYYMLKVLKSIEIKAKAVTSITPTAIDYNMKELDNNVSEQSMITCVCLLNRLRIIPIPIVPKPGSKFDNILIHHSVEVSIIT